MSTTKIPNRQDARVQRTHHKLREALIALILERGYDNVSIRSVAERAGVGRSTFYVHFGSLEEVLLSRGDSHAWLRHFERGRSGELFSFSEPFLEHAFEQRRLWRALVGNKGGSTIQRHFKTSIVVILREDLPRVLPTTRPEIIEAKVQYLAGAFTGVLFSWLDCPSKVTPRQMAELFESMSRQALGLPSAASIGGPRPSGERG